MCECHVKFPDKGQNRFFWGTGVHVHCKLTISHTIMVGANYMGGKRSVPLVLLSFKTCFPLTHQALHLPRNSARSRSRDWQGKAEKRHFTKKRFELLQKTLRSTYPHSDNPPQQHFSINFKHATRDGATNTPGPRLEITHKNVIDTSASEGHRSAYINISGKPRSGNTQISGETLPGLRSSNTMGDLENNFERAFLMRWLK